MKVRYEIIEEAAGDAIVTIDEEGSILSISKAAERIFGFKTSEMVHQAIETLVPGFLERVDAVRRNGSDVHVIEVTGRTKAGADIQLELSLGEYNKNNRHVLTG